MKFSVYKASSYSETYVLDFNFESEFTQYINMAINQSLIRIKHVPTDMNQIITLSTCDNVNDDTRMIVHARLVQR